MPIRCLALPVSGLLGLLLVGPIVGEEYAPSIYAIRSDEGENAIRTFAVPKGMTAELVAAEPDLANPVCFCIDARGRFYIGETFRQKKGVEDNRSHMNWLHDDLAAQTVADRVAFFRKHLGEKVADYTKEHDRIRLLEDTDGDGKVDKATVFADGFNRIEDGTGAGLLARNGDVYYTCIPDLWRLRDTDGDGKADERESLHTGYGVRVAFRGHDMHGLVMGPDGRLYYSIGDRGYNVTTKEGKRLVRPDTGAVFRCEPDGSNLEVFAYGLRNPQELAFDDFGNLFTGDNNSDSGDRARWVHVVKGGDTGWRMYFQYLDDRGPWNREMMWYPIDSELKKPEPGKVPAGSTARDLQPSYIVPPVANLGDGPSGLVAYPGVGLSERYDGHFFLCDFRGNASNSGVRSFAVKPKGASFELVDSHEFLWRTLVTDVDFGYDGAMYTTDWVAGWDGPGKGRLYRFTDDEHVGSAAGVADLFRESFADRSTEELVELLSHADRRVRQEAQFALVDAAKAMELNAVARDATRPVTQRLHGVFGLGQLTRRGNTTAATRLNVLLTTETPEVVAAAARTLGDSVTPGSEICTHCLEVGSRARLHRLLDHESIVVRAAAAEALASLGNLDSVSELLGVLDTDDTEDPVLRNAAVVGLVGIAERHPAALTSLLAHPGNRGRMGVLLALRRLESTEVVRYLTDGEPALRLEAARAINDVPIPAATRDLAELAGQPLASDALVRRVMNANYRIGGESGARAVAGFAADESLSERLRLEAVEQLHSWAKPHPIDRVTGRWAPLDDREQQEADAAVRTALPAVLAGSDKLREAGIRLAATYGIEDVAPTLVALLRDSEQPANVRAESLVALRTIGSDDLVTVAEDVLANETAAELRIAARSTLVELQPEKAVELLEAAIFDGATTEKQAAVRELRNLDPKTVEPTLRRLAEDLSARKLPIEIQLDVVETLREVETKYAILNLAKYHDSRPADDPLRDYLETLAGGDVARGENVFFGRSAASCRRCHKVQGNGGIVGPDLSAIGKQKDARYLLEAIVQPNAKIAKGFETVVVVDFRGKVHAGILKAEDDDFVNLMTPDGQIVVVAKDDIEDRAVGKSGMPEDIVRQLTKSDIRDLVAYLSSLKTDPAPEGHSE